MNAELNRILIPLRNAGSELMRARDLSSETPVLGKEIEEAYELVTELVVRITKLQLMPPEGQTKYP